MFWVIFASLCGSKGEKPNPVAKKIGISSATVTQWKNGSIPSGENLIKIADYFNCSIDYLLGRTDNPDGFTEPVSNSITISDQHKKLLSLFDTLDEYQQNKIMGMLELYAFENEEARREEA